MAVTPSTRERQGARQGIRLAIAGTVMMVPSRRPDFYASLLPDAVTSILRGADIAVCDLETCLSSRPTAYDKAVSLVVPPAYAEALRAWHLTHANIVHNHSLDAGREGFEETQAAISSAGVHPINGTSETGGTPTIVAVQGKQIGLAAFTAIGELGTLYAAQTAALREIALLRPVVDHLVVFYHDGYDLASYPLPDQHRRCRQFVDAGADAVIVNQSHVYQGYEFYRGKPIVHSTGNLVVFSTEDARWAPTNRGAVVVLTFGPDAVGAEEHFFTIGDDLQVRPDDPEAQLSARAHSARRARAYAAVRYSTLAQLAAMGAIARPFLLQQVFSGILPRFKRQGMLRGLLSARCLINRFHLALYASLCLRIFGLRYERMLHE